MSGCGREFGEGLGGHRIGEGVVRHQSDGDRAGLVALPTAGGGYHHRQEKDCEAWHGAGPSFGGALAAVGTPFAGMIRIRFLRSEALPFEGILPLSPVRRAPVCLGGQFIGVLMGAVCGRLNSPLGVGRNDQDRVVTAETERVRDDRAGRPINRFPDYAGQWDLGVLLGQSDVGR